MGVDRAIMALAGVKLFKEQLYVYRVLPTTNEKSFCTVLIIIFLVETVLRAIIVLLLIILG